MAQPTADQEERLDTVESYHEPPPLDEEKMKMFD